MVYFKDPWYVILEVFHSCFVTKWMCLITGPSTEPAVVESKDRKANAHFILKLLCDSVVLQPYLRELLSAK